MYSKSGQCSVLLQKCCGLSNFLVEKDIIHML